MQRWGVVVVLRQYNLSINKKRIGTGVLSVDGKGEAHFFSDDGGMDSRVLAHMLRTELAMATTNCLVLRGFSPSGKRGDSYKLVEWVLFYINDMGGAA